MEIIHSIQCFKEPDLYQQVQREIELWEILRKNIYPDVASYLGCQVSCGRLSGICLRRYISTLGTWTSLSSLTIALRLIESSRKHVKTGVRAGIKHFHSL